MHQEVCFVPKYALYFTLTQTQCSRCSGVFSRLGVERLGDAGAATNASFFFVLFFFTRQLKQFLRLDENLAKIGRTP